MASPVDGTIADVSVEIFEDSRALFAAGADRVIAAAKAAVAQRRRFTIALSGGSTPRGLYRVLGEEPRRSAMPWSSTQIFWGDERHVAPSDPDSNYRMTLEALLSNVPIPPQQVHRIKAEEPDARVAALMYEHDLREVFQIAPGTVPRFDCILLGLGGDGHTASLFPNTAALDEETRLVVANDVPQLHTDRITLTYPVLNAAALVLFLVEGEGKAGILPEVLRPGSTLPSARVHPIDGEVIWMIDRAAAANLTS